MKLCTISFFTSPGPDEEHFAEVAVLLDDNEGEARRWLLANDYSVNLDIEYVIELKTAKDMDGNKYEIKLEQAQ